MLFQRILSNCTLDWFRRQKTRNALFSNLSDFESASRRRRFRPAGNLCGSSTALSRSESAEDTTRRAQILREIEAEIQELPGPSTRSIPDALLGGHGRGRDGGGHGLLGRQCQDPLFPGGPGPQQSTEGKGITTMNARTRDLALSRQDQFGRRVAARLAAATLELPHDITERLRAARVQALAQRKIAALQAAGPVQVSGGQATLGGDERPGWWHRLASALPLVALVAGLVTIHVVQNDRRASELAEVDAALLTDDLPPAAYTDPGFVQFLKSGRRSGRRHARPPHACDRGTRPRRARAPAPLAVALAGQPSALRMPQPAHCAPPSRRSKATAARRSAASAPRAKPAWAELTPAQQHALKPLAAILERHVSEAHKRKWLALSQNFRTHVARRAGQAAQPHDRVGRAEPAAAHPGAPELRRGQAACSPDDKKAKWEAYQALSPEEKRKLAAGAPGQHAAHRRGGPAGAAAEAGQRAAQWPRRQGAAHRRRSGPRAVGHAEHARLRAAQAA